MTKEPATSSHGRRQPTQPKTPVQTRSRDRVSRILSFTEKLLERCAVDEVTIGTIADGTGINRSSIHQFFPNIFSVYRALSLKHIEDQEVYLRSLLKKPGTTDRLGLFDLIINASADYYNAHPGPRKLMLGSGGDFQMRIVDNDYDRRAADLTRELCEPALNGVPTDEGDPTRVAMAIVTAIFTLSVEQDGSITPFYRRQAIMAARAYLGCWTAAPEIPAAPAARKKPGAGPLKGVASPNHS